MIFNTLPTVPWLVLFSQAQQESFPELFNSREKEKGHRPKLPENHSLSGVVPFVDANGLARIGGRLREASIQFEVKHPIVLDGRHVITRRYVEFIHEQAQHQGRVITLSMVREAGVFIVGGRRLVDSVIRNCVQCAKLRSKTAGQLMADLPKERVTEAAAAFTDVGADVFGPFIVEEGQTTRARSSKIKVFVLLLTCLASRAVHLEPLSGMDTSSMVNALKRFISLRGKCRSIWSDNGTNFIGALGQMDDFYRLQEAAKAEGIAWHLNPIGASHFGGVFERKIGSVRRVLEACLKKHAGRLVRDDLYTLLQEAAAVVNHTPLYAIPDDAGEPLPISPSMLLTLRTPADVSSPPQLFTDRDVMAYGQRRWRRVQFLADEFWKLWRSHYLQELTVRGKWTREKPSLRKDDVVVVREKNVPRNEWRMARVRDVMNSRDGLARRVKVELLNAQGKLKISERAIHDLVLLYRPQSQV